MAFIQLTSADNDDQIQVNVAAIAAVTGLRPGKCSRTGVVLIGDPEPYYVREDFDTVTQMIAEAAEPVWKRGPSAEVVAVDDPFGWPTGGGF